ncbi:hypothetical protein D3C75_697210 [compost metagenome]
MHHAIRINGSTENTWSVIQTVRSTNCAVCFIAYIHPMVTGYRAVRYIETTAPVEVCKLSSPIMQITALKPDRVVDWLRTS